MGLNAVRLSRLWITKAEVQALAMICPPCNSICGTWATAALLDPTLIPYTDSALSTKCSHRLLLSNTSNYSHLLLTSSYEVGQYFWLHFVGETVLMSKEVKQAGAQILFLKFARSPLFIPDSNAETLQWAGGGARRRSEGCLVAGVVHYRRTSSNSRRPGS